MFVGAGDIADCGRTPGRGHGRHHRCHRRQRLDGRRQRLPEPATPPTSRTATSPAGAARSRHEPVRFPGNHDWDSSGADTLAGYFGYFGANATDAAAQSYYSYDIAGSNWHVVNLDTECQDVPGGCCAPAPRRSCGSRPTSPPTAARTSSPSGTSRATARASPTDQDLQPFWDDLYAFGRRHPARRPRPHLRAVRPDQSGARWRARRSPTRPTASGSSPSAPAARRSSRAPALRSRPARPATAAPTA